MLLRRASCEKKKNVSGEVFALHKMISARVWSLEATQQLLADELATLPPPSKHKKPSPAEDSCSCQWPTAGSTNRRHGQGTVLSTGQRMCAAVCLPPQGGITKASSQVPLIDSEWVGALQSVFLSSLGDSKVQPE